MIKVLMIDDTSFYANNIKRILNKTKNFSFIGNLDNATNIVKNIKSMSPDVILLDSLIGNIKGIDLIKNITTYTNIPIIYYSDIDSDSFVDCIESLKRGALDFMLKPLQRTDIDWSEFENEILTKIGIAANANLENIETRINKVNPVKAHTNIKKLVVVASSTGGVQTLMKIIPQFPKIINAPIVIVQHMPSAFTKQFANDLDKLSSIHVKEAQDNEILMKDTVYIAKGGFHHTFLVDDNEVKILLDKKPEVLGLRPYANYTFISAAEIFKKNCIGVVLTGMGNDGSNGIKTIKEYGGTTIAQSQDDCLLYGMPKAAIETGKIDQIIRLKDIPQKIVDIINT